MRNFIHSRYALIVTAVVVTICACMVALGGYVAYPPEIGGVIADWSSQWVANPVVNLCAGLAVALATAFILAVLTKRFNILKSMTMLHATTYLVLQLAVPASLVYLNTGALLCVVMAVCYLLMFVSYGDVAMSQRRVFLAFVLLSAYSTVDYLAIVYMPVFVLATVQMRIISLRTVLAMLMGIVTPWIIILGFGLADVNDVSFRLVWWGNSSNAKPAVMVAQASFTLFVVVAAWMQNLIKIVTYNAQARAYLSVISVTTLVTLVIFFVDYTQFYSYMPMLNMCAALQVGHLFATVHTQAKSYWAYLLLVALYVGFLVWHLI